jgi:hypothetical protein
MPKADAPTYRYRFAGDVPEDFPQPPIARRLEPGDEVEANRPIDHARLEPTPETVKQLVADRKAAEKEAAQQDPTTAGGPPANPTEE